MATSVQISRGGGRVTWAGVVDVKGNGLPIKMLHDRVLVSLRKEDGERRSTGGILIPATAQVAKRLVWGEARGVGNSVRQVKVGDQVLFSPEDQHEVEVHGEDLVILRERDVHAVAAERIEDANTGLYL
ncbi:GroES family chaperonin [Trujillonella humicola]|uniref:GroES family chaperonin n=1 Tax=Trujillonella humicola TaxID=3383699 RepID=UPI00390697A7